MAVHPLTKPGRQRGTACVLCVAWWVSGLVGERERFDQARVTVARNGVGWWNASMTDMTYHVR